jgi:hypothetical protein
MDLKGRRLWYRVVAVIVVVVVIAYAAGWFGGTPIPAPQQWERSSFSLGGSWLLSL